MNQRGNAMVVVLGIVLVASIWLTLWLTQTTQPLRNGYYDYFQKSLQAKSEALWYAQSLLRLEEQKQDTASVEVPEAHYQPLFKKPSSSIITSEMDDEKMNVNWTDSTHSFQFSFGFQLPKAYEQTKLFNPLDFENKLLQKNLNTHLNKQEAKFFNTWKKTWQNPDIDIRNPILDAKELDRLNHFRSGIALRCSEALCELKDVEIWSKEEIEFIGAWKLKGLKIYANEVRLSEGVQIEQSEIYTNTSLKINDAEGKNNYWICRGTVHLEHMESKSGSTWLSFLKTPPEIGSPIAPFYLGDFVSLFGNIFQGSQLKTPGLRKPALEISPTSIVRGILLSKSSVVLEGRLNGLFSPFSVNCGGLIEEDCFEQNRSEIPNLKIPLWVLKGYPNTKLKFLAQKGGVK